jgi:hypothetical protein
MIKIYYSISDINISIKGIKNINTTKVNDLGNAKNYKNLSFNQ